MTEADRTLPHSLDAERSVLGAVLVTYGRVLDEIPDLASSAFYRAAHARLYQAMLVMHGRGDAVDFVTLKDELARSNELDEVGGPSYIAGLADGMPAAVNVKYYARIVRDKAAARGVIYAAGRLMTAAYEEHDLGSLVDQVERALLDISAGAVPGELVPAHEMAKEIYPVVDQLFSDRRPVTGLSSGFATLDRYTRGFQRGNLIVLAARPGGGKTSVGVQVALHVAQSWPVAFFSLEMSRQELEFRAVTTLAGVDGHLLQCGQLSPTDQGMVGSAIAELGNLKLWVDDTAAISAVQVRSKARRLKTQRGTLGLIVVDYLQLLQPGGKRPESREQAVAEMTRTLKQVARDLDVPVLVLSQLSRRVEERPGKRPQLSDLRESGAIEQDADLVLFIHRPPAESDGIVQVTPPAEIIIAKQRNGPTTSIELSWTEEQMRFSELETREAVA